MKKTASIFSPHFRKRWLKPLLIMRLTALLILITALQVSAKTYSKERVSVDFNHTNLPKVLKTVEHKNSYRFIFSTDVLSDNLKVTMDKIIVKGTVTDDKGNPLPNVSVTTSKGIGTTTNNKGEYSITVDEDEILTFSFVGFTSETIEVDKRGVINVVLKGGNNQLSDVVVVGYGTQKRVNISGSVATVSGKTIEKRPAPNLQNLLQGRVAGLDIVQPTGEPGRDNASILIRGMGSYGASSSPLILVDGVTASISNLSPQDIESVTVLKDAASASIYGARAANGVILITTKKGKAGRNIVEYNGSWGTSEATRYPDLITNSVTYMEMYNAANARSGRAPQYTQDQIDAYKNNSNSEQYPNFNWLDHVLGKGPIQQHNLGFSGGTDKTTYNLSLNYLDQNSITKGYTYKRYNALFDFATQVNKKVKVGANINFSYQDEKAPWLTNDNLLLMAYASAPTFKPFLPDGSGRVANRDYAGNSAGNRNVEEVYNTGGQFTKNYNVNAQGFVDVDIIKGLKWFSKGAITFFNQEYKNRQFGSPSYAYHPDPSGVFPQVANGNPSYFGLQENSERDITKTFYSTLDYTRRFSGDHNLNVLAGYEQEDNRSTYLNGNRYDFPNNTIMELDGSTGKNQSTGGDASEWAL